jgi:hypothetical protein
VGDGGKPLKHQPECGSKRPEHFSAGRPGFWSPPTLFVGGTPMTRLRLYAVLLAVFLLACGAAWYLFRPEKAFIDDVVDEPFPTEHR